MSYSEPTPPPRRDPQLTKEELGRAAWTVIHATALTIARPGDGRRYADMVSGLMSLYPCCACKDEAYKSRLIEKLQCMAAQMDDPLSGKRVDPAPFVKWSYKFHEFVNRRLDKKGTFPSTSVRERWSLVHDDDGSARCSATSR
jgi:hypothetical protein